MRYHCLDDIDKGEPERRRGCACGSSCISEGDGEKREEKVLPLLNHCNEVLQ